MSLEFGKLDEDAKGKQNEPSVRMVFEACQAVALASWQKVLN